MASSSPCSSTSFCSSSTSSTSTPILCVGLVCLDIINLCDHYPSEDEDMQATDQQWRSGGNASNSSIVLSLLGRSVEFMGTIGSGMETDFVLSRLQRVGVTHSSCVRHPNCRLPTSYIVLNMTNGSRTIVHYRNLPELTSEDFCSNVDLSRYQWIHFEGRHVPEYARMIQHVAAYNDSLKAVDSGGKTRRLLQVSVELEKKGPELAELAPLADVILMSKVYAQYQGYGSMEEAVRGFRSRTKKDAIVMCAWGEEGAAATDKEGKVYRCRAFPPAKVVDTIGAGDTFNAGIIHSLLLGNSVEAALTFACRLAGSKCGMLGFDGLRNFQSDSSLMYSS